MGILRSCRDAWWSFGFALLNQHGVIFLAVKWLLLLHTSRNTAVCFTCPSCRYYVIMSVVDHATPLREQESNLPLLSICFIQHIIIGGFGELQPASTPKSSFALEGDVFDVDWDGAMHNAWACREMTLPGHDGRCGPLYSNLWLVPAAWRITVCSFHRGWCVLPGSVDGLGLCVAQQDTSPGLLWSRKSSQAQLLWQYTGPHEYSLFHYFFYMPSLGWS